MQNARSAQRSSSRCRLLWLGCLALLVGLPGAAASPASATTSTSTSTSARTAWTPTAWTPTAGSLSLGPPLYRGKLTAKKKGSKCQRGCAATCKTLTLTPSQFQLHCNAKGYPGLVIFAGKRCKKAGKKIHCWFKNKQLIFHGTKTQ